MIRTGKRNGFQGAMTEFEYWLLDIVILHRIPLSWLLWEDIGLILNKKIALPASPQLIHLLEDLFGRGDVALFKEDFNSDIKPSREELRTALLDRENTSIYYGVTQQGGARWEGISMPDWNKYLYASYGTDPNNGEIISINHDLAKQHLSMEIYQGHVILTESITWDQLIPWEITYWKTLPIGYRAKFNFSQQRPSLRNENLRNKKWARWINKLNQWYENPFIPGSTE